MENVEGEDLPKDLIREDTGLPLATAEKYGADRERWRKNVNTKLFEASIMMCAARLGRSG